MVYKLTYIVKKMTLDISMVKNIFLFAYYNVNLTLTHDTSH